MPSSSHSKRLALESAQLFLSPYCWSPQRLNEFVKNCWNLVKDEKGQALPSDIRQFRDLLNSEATDYELWAPNINWTDHIPDDEFNFLRSKKLGTPKQQIKEADELMRLIRNKQDHVPTIDLHENPGHAHLLHLNWKDLKGDELNYVVSEYWVSKFVLLPILVWSQFHSKRSSLSQFYPCTLLDTDTDQRDIFFRPEEFAKRVHETCLDQLDHGFVENRFKLSSGQSTLYIEVRTLPADGENLLSKVLCGDSLLKVVVSPLAVTSQRNGDDKIILTYNTWERISTEQCATYIFLSSGYKMSKNFKDDLLDGSTEKIIIFTEESAIPALSSTLNALENAETVPLSWRDLSRRKRVYIANGDEYKFVIQSREFGIGEILPTQERGFLVHLEGKELKTLLRERKLPVLHKCQLPELDRFYQERKITDPYTVIQPILKPLTHTDDDTIASSETLQLSESEFLDIIRDSFARNKVTFIVNESGMGKSQFLANITNKLAISEDIPIFIYATHFMADLIKVVGESIDSTWEDIIAALLSHLSSTKFESEILGRLLKSQDGSKPQGLARTIIWLDGVDEVKLELRKLTLKTIQTLHESLPGLPIIATVRDNMASEINHRFEKCGYELSPIEDLCAFIKSYWLESVRARIFSPSLGVIQGERRKYFFTRSPDLSIPEDQLLSTVNSFHPEKRIVVIYEDIDAKVSPLLFKLSSILNERGKPLLFYGNESIIKIQFAHFKPGYGNRFKGTYAEDIIYDCLSICSEQDYDSLRSYLIKLVEFTKLEEAPHRLWIILQSLKIKDFKIPRLDALEINVEPASNFNKDHSLSLFWQDNLENMQEELGSHMTELAQELCRKTGSVRLPIECRMVGEISAESVFRLDFKGWERFDISPCNLYKELFRRKYETFLRNQNQIPTNVEIKKKYFGGFMKGRNRFLQYLSLKLIFSEKTANQFKEKLEVTDKVKELEEYYEDALALKILQNRDPLRFGHMTQAEYLVSEFIYKSLKKCTNNFTCKLSLDDMEIGDKALNDLILNLVLTTTVDSNGIIVLKYLGIVKFLNARLEGKNILTEGESQDFRERFVNLSFFLTLPNQNSFRLNEGIDEIFSAMKESKVCLFNIYSLLLHSRKHLLWIFLAASVNQNFKVADFVVNKVGLRLQSLDEIVDFVDDKKGVLHWAIIGLFGNLGFYGDVYEFEIKILEYCVGLGKRREDWVEARNSKGQTPLLLLVDLVCSHYCNEDLFYLHYIKLFKFFVKGLRANLNVMDDDGNTVLHYIMGRVPSLSRESINFKASVQFFSERTNTTNPMNKFGFTPVVNFMHSLHSNFLHEIGFIDVLVD